MSKLRIIKVWLFIGFMFSFPNIELNARQDFNDSPTVELCKEIVRVPANFSKIQDLFLSGADISCHCDVIQRTYFIGMDRIMINFFSNKTSELDVQANTDDNYLVERVSVTPMQVALSREDYSLMRFLLDNGMDLNTICCDGMYPLEYAFHHNKQDLVDFLLENGANPKLIKLGCPFDIEMTKYMIAKGADPNTIKIDCALWDKNRATALLKLKPDMKGEVADFKFNELLEKPKLLAFLLENSFSPNGLEEGNKRTLLSLAAEKGKIEVLNLLLKYKADVHQKDEKGLTPLCYAVQNNHAEIVKKLVNEGAEINLSLEIENRKSSPLAIAVRQRNPMITKLLLENGADSDMAGEDLLTIAVKNDDRSIVAELVKYGDEPNRLFKLYGKDFLFQDTHLFEFVLERGAQPSEEDGFTVQAIKEGKEDIANVLIKHKAGLNSLDENGLSPLHYAFVQSNYTLAYQLIEAGANLNQTIDGFAPFLHRAVADRNIVMVHKLLQNGAEVDILNTAKESALVVAVKDKNYDLVKLLLRYKIAIGCEEVFQAILLENVSIVKLLVEAGADLDCKKDNLSLVAFAKKNNISYQIEQYLKGKYK